MQSTVYRCDICGIAKGDQNHWFRVRVGEAFHAYRWDYTGEGAEDSSVPHYHVCGHAHAMLLFQAFLDNKPLEIYRLKDGSQKDIQPDKESHHELNET